MLYQNKDTSVLKHALMTSAGEWIEELMSLREEEEIVEEVKIEIKPLFNRNNPNDMIYNIIDNKILQDLKSSKITCSDEAIINKTTDELRYSLKTSSFGPMKLKDAMPILQGLIDDDDFYGVIASEKNRGNSAKINLYHPMVALHINENWDVFKDLEYTYYVYSGNWNEKKYSITSQEKTNIERKIEDILSLKSSQSTVSKRVSYVMKNETGRDIDFNNRLEVKKEIKRRIINNFNFRIVATDRFYNSDGSEIRGDSDSNFNYVVPVQILNDGLAYPYYGVSIIMLDNGSHGVHISPMCSSNIGSLDSSHLRSNTSIARASVCTGSLNSSSILGLKSLNHSNLSSPFWTNNLIGGWEEWVLSSLQISKSIYSEILEPLEEIVSEVEDTRTEKEKFLEHNPGGDWYKFLYEESQAETDEADIAEAQLAEADISVDFGLSPDMTAISRIDTSAIETQRILDLIDTTAPVEPESLESLIPSTGTTSTLELIPSTTIGES